MSLTREVSGNLSQLGRRRVKFVELRVASHFCEVLLGYPFFVLRESFSLSKAVSAHTLPAVDMGAGKVVWDASVSIL
jgi:hypothetical protein